MQSLKGLDAYLVETLSSCCGVWEREQAQICGVEQHMRIEHHQPRLVPPPFPEPAEHEPRGREWVSKTKSFASRASSRGSFTVKRTLNAYNGPRDTSRLRIGAPTDFRHVEQFKPRSRTGGFRPLELSIYLPENQTSPLSSHFGLEAAMSFPTEPFEDLPIPPRTAMASRDSSLSSYRIPRKPIRSSSGASGSSEWTAHYKPRPDSLSTEELLACLESDLPKPLPMARLRSMTEPPAYYRVRSVLHEKYELDKQLKDIEEVIEERKSIYLNSRRTSRATIRPETTNSNAAEPMPAHPDVRSFTPVIPPTAPSFAARVVTNARPKTAPSKSAVHIPTRLKSFTEASATFNNPAPSTRSTRAPSRTDRDLPPPPPLPLVLQGLPPPLRKKKSFSRVSGWLFPSAADHARSGSVDSITNTPKALTSKDGFYQCFTPPQQRDSFDSVSTMVTLEESEIDDPTTHTGTVSTPNSSPSMGHRTDRGVQIRQLSMDAEIEHPLHAHPIEKGENERSYELMRTRTFGENEEGWKSEKSLPNPLLNSRVGKNSVGVAF